MRNKIINCSTTCARHPFTSIFHYYAKCRPTAEVLYTYIYIEKVQLYSIFRAHSTHFSLAVPPIEISVTAILVEFYCIPTTTTLCSCVCVCVRVHYYRSVRCSLYCGLATFVMRPELCSALSCSLTAGNFHKKCKSINTDCNIF